jgi:16S rRNA (cytosine967-C5)-methyltransferase
LCRRPLAKLDPEVRAALRLGLVEIMKLEMEPALATDGAVRLVKRLGRSSAAGMVNAVLRKAAQAWPRALESSEIDVKLSHPWWIYDRWSRSFGERAAYEGMASAQHRALTWVWFRREDGRRRLEDDGVELLPHPWCPGAWTAPEEARSLVSEVERGAAFAQDPSSQLVAHAAVRLSGSHRSFLDICAAPGGKTALVSELGSWNRMVAADLRLGRARLVRELARDNPSLGVVAADGAQPPFIGESWGVVLLDAPCSGTGTFRRHPELKWRLEPASVTAMACIQRRLLESALQLVAPGGVLVYATCSVEVEENEGVVVPRLDGFEAVDVRAVLPDGVPARSTDALGARILPNEDGDGFTMHALRRVG